MIEDMPAKRPEPMFAAMEFVMQYQTTADKNFIYEASRQIKLLWKHVEMNRARYRGTAADQPRRSLRLVGD